MAGIDLRLVKIEQELRRLARLRDENALLQARLAQSVDNMKCYVRHTLKKRAELRKKIGGIIRWKTLEELERQIRRTIGNVNLIAGGKPNGATPVFLTRNEKTTLHLLLGRAHKKFLEAEQRRGLGLVYLSNADKCLLRTIIQERRK